MNLYPRDIFEKLEFDKILSIIESYCLGITAMERVSKIAPSSQAQIIEIQLEEVYECKKTYEHPQTFPVFAYTDIQDDLKLLAIEGYVLSPESLKDISILLKGVQKYYNFFSPKTENRVLFPNLYQLIRWTDFDEGLIKSIDKVVDEEGNIRADASPDLLKIVKLQSSKRQELDKKFRQVATVYLGKNYLADNVESFRNGRRVLAVFAEYKRQIKGILHDESSTGKTVFIEPEEVIDINNDLFDLEQEYKREIFRIIRVLSSTLRPYVDTISKYFEITVKFDVIQAKAQFAHRVNAVKPKLFNNPHFKIERAFHPLLLVKNSKSSQKTVPFDFKLLHENRILVLSGPNAGGKSISMKAVGLLQIMLQSSILVPVEEGSEMGIFDKLFVDIGDQQSLENELSTYSSRLENAKFFLENADQKSLVLIDEFGSGTDPKAGAAIAESILKDLNQKRVYGVITTHYSNLKTFAFNNRGLVNGHMVFNMKALSPTYELKIGKPGSSYAFEIANKTGLSEKIINYAKRQVGEKELNFDEMIIDLQKEKQQLQETQKSLEEQQKQLDQLIKNYEYAQKELEFGRKKLKVQIKEIELLDLQINNKEIQKLLKELRDEDDKQKALSKAQEILNKSKEEQVFLHENIETIKEDIYKVYEEKDHGVIEVGSMVKMRDGGMTGTVKEIKKKEAFVEMEHISITVKLRDLILISNPIELNQGNKIKMEILQKQSVFDNSIDIRGMRYENALETLQDFLDNALLSNALEIKIIHGKGSGILRKAVKQKLREYPNIKEIKYASPEQGGDGKTIVVFE